MSCITCLSGLHIKPATIRQILEKKEKTHQKNPLSTEAKMASLVNETRIVGTEKSETPKIELQFWNKNGEDGNG